MARQSLAPEHSDLPTVLLTRPEAQSQRFAADLLNQLGPLRIVISPLMVPEFGSCDLTGRSYTGIILTSETAADSARRILASGQTLPRQAFCVGDRTAKAAQAAGFDAISANGDAAALIGLIQSIAPVGPLLHLRGADTRGEVAETLTKGGIVTESVATYAQLAQPLSEQALQALTEKTPLILPLFSPRSASLMATALPMSVHAPLWVAAISPATSDAARGLAPAKSLMASHPDGKAMLHTVAELISMASNA